MSRMIDADALIDLWKGCTFEGDITPIIANAPTIEPEPHFCRDCKWVTYHGSVDKHGTVEALWHCHNWDGGTDEEGFCHKWERRA